MKGFRYKHKENTFRFVRWLGFSVINIFEIEQESLEEMSDFEIIMRSINSGFFSDKYIEVRDVNKDFEIKEFKHHRYHGPINLDKIDNSNFKKLTYSELLERIKLFQEENDLGEELPVFIELFNHAKQDIERLDLLNRNFFCIINDLNKNQWFAPNFYSYFINIIVLCKEKNEIVIIDFGSD
jgi:hypothetical protein